MQILQIGTALKYSACTQACASQVLSPTTLIASRCLKLCVAAGGMTSQTPLLDNSKVNLRGLQSVCEKRRSRSPAKTLGTRAENKAPSSANPECYQNVRWSRLSLAALRRLYCQDESLGQAQ